MEIREFRWADYEEVIALWKRAGLLPGRSDERGEIEKKLSRDPDLFLVGIEAGAIVAAVIGGYDGRRAWIYHLAVEPGLHARGFGTLLLDELESRLRKKGCLKVNLHIEPENSSVMHFYQQCGYAHNELIFMGKWLS
jgi:ribosomal protein S18 acetylase RimI-like enzyme